jgi:hypothetical protein
MSCMNLHFLDSGTRLRILINLYVTFQSYTSSGRLRVPTYGLCVQAQQ